MRRVSIAAAAAAAIGLAVSASAQPVPELRFEAPPALQPDLARVSRFDHTRLTEVAGLVGLDDAGPPIQVVLAAADSRIAADAPEHVAGFAVGRASLIVLFPSRSPVYPDDSLEDVLRHEVAHVLIDRAAAGREVPRWFHEGLATTAEREAGLGDRTRLIYELTLSVRTDLDALDELFAGDRRAMVRAYTLSGAFVRFLLAEYGRGLPRALLARVAEGVPFQAAFVDVTGDILPYAEARFWDAQRPWTVWAPFVTSPTALWMVVTVLVLVAIHRRRQRSRARRARWAAEGDEALPEVPAPDEPDTGPPRDP